MVNYRRDYTPGGTYFFTVTLKNRQSNYLTTYIKQLGIAFRSTRNRSFFNTYAISVLPEHLHVIWQLPLNDCDYSGRWKMIKSLFTQQLVALGVPLTKNKSGRYNLWQNRYWEHLIKDDRDLEGCCNYIHYNPVKHKYVDHPTNWPYSSIHRFISAGILPKNWGGTHSDGAYGEL